MYKCTWEGVGGKECWEDRKVIKLYYLIFLSLPISPYTYTSHDFSKSCVFFPLWSTAAIKDKGNCKC